MDGRKRILFVDEDPGALEGLRTDLEDTAGEWDLVFAGSGERALEAFAQAPFDAIVTGLALPDLPVSQLLQQILVGYPATLRFVLAGGDPEEAAEVVDRTHQFFRKPCAPAFLKEALRRALLPSVNDAHARELVARIGRLPSVPALYLEINQLLDSERATVDNLAAAIGKDLAMTAMLLKLANSAFFSPRQPVATPREAVAILGLDLLRSLVLAHGLFTQSGGFHFPAFSLAHLWRHSVAVACAARQIATLEGEGRAGAAEYFTAGLLHDVGILILASRFPDGYFKVLAAASNPDLTLEALETQALGAAHGEVGGYLLGLWGLPPAVVQAAALHHQPSRLAPLAFTPALAVHIADSLLAKDPEHEVFAMASLDEPCLRSLGLWERVPEWRANLQQDTGGLRNLV